jgi:hypothetical protein
LLGSSGVLICSNSIAAQSFCGIQAIVGASQKVIGRFTGLQLDRSD